MQNIIYGFSHYTQDTNKKESKQIKIRNRYGDTKGRKWRKTIKIFNGSLEAQTTPSYIFTDQQLLQRATNTLKLQNRT